ncbi:hypothetical protein AGABI2DRAFT_182583 [Agaricus bisporus var. bisporus H97]|uniref:hypothetical protein n=1 Tax=Agaricus bisporus var. bisporus (strain H97 / ATCC MYA-4626 / FGSC 10389) TaxID=936046 RepID=UPI00029F61E4|nr:hypothetical protein AGABI2DRAFT_182583 [Agaricus bisporus var. bisporus H97]EKV51634.1 hypothetical protein AGABI2DRAFT_182583 [Agaricus bisporus var. bisporus H97]
MSAAASRLELEKPLNQGYIPTGNETEPIEDEGVAVGKLTGITPDPTIAVDLDDVLSQTNQAVADWHNEVYGTDMDLSHFYYYYYWKNPYWGTVQDTFNKLEDFYKTDRLYKASPVPGALKGLQTLRDMGFRLIIVTARQEDKADESWKWVTKHFPGIFENIICTGQFKDTHKSGHEVVTKLNKPQICKELGAKLLIDDSVENALQCVNASEPVPVLLFGDYEWNRRVSSADDMTFDIRLEACDGREFWREETVPIPKGAALWRVRDWKEVVQWVHQAQAEGRI